MTDGAADQRAGAQSGDLPASQAQSAGLTARYIRHSHWRLLSDLSVLGRQLSACHKEPARSKQNTPSRGFGCPNCFLCHKTADASITREALDL